MPKTHHPDPATGVMTQLPLPPSPFHHLPFSTVGHVPHHGASKESCHGLNYDHYTINAALLYRWPTKTAYVSQNYARFCKELCQGLYGGLFWPDWRSTSVITSRLLPTHAMHCSVMYWRHYLLHACAALHIRCTSSL